MSAFKVGDKVTHFLFPDYVFTVFHDYTTGRMLGARRAVGEAVILLTAPASEFTPYVPPRPSTHELALGVARAFREWSCRNLPGEIGDLTATQALAEAATAYAERLEEEAQA